MTAKKKARAKTSSSEISADFRIVVLKGKDASIRSLQTDRLREQLAERCGEVETIRFDGVSAAAADVLDECRSMSLLRSHKLVVVDAADQLVKEENRPLIERYAESPAEGATLVLRAETWRKGKLDALIEREGAILNCNPLSEARAVAWACKRAEKRHGAALGARGAEALIARVGTDLGRLDSELAKLAAAAGAGEITVEIVRELTAATREEEVWGVQQELLSGDAARALGSIDEALRRARHAPALVSYAAMDLARKVRVVRAALDAGAPEAGVSRIAGVWGPSQRAILAEAKRRPAQEISALFHAAVTQDADAKSGRVDPERALEALAVRFTSPTPPRADTR